MGAIRIQSEIYSDSGVRYRVNIWDSDYASSILTFDNDGFELEYDRITDPLAPVISSSVYFNLIDDGSANFSGFKNDLAQALEDEFKLYIEKHDGSNWVIYWAGVIMTDMVQWDNDNTPRRFEIVAKDGLNRLSDIYFDKLTSSPYSTNYEASLLQIIKDCLSYAGTAQFWNGSSKSYIINGMQSHDTLQTAITQAKILELVFIGKEYLIDDPLFNKDYTQVTFRGSNDRPLKAREILESLLQIFRLRIIQSDGSWYIQEVNKLRLASYTGGNYDYTSTYTSSSTISVQKAVNSTTFRLLAGGKFGYYPAVRLAKAQVYPSNILNGTFFIDELIDKNNTTFTTSAFALGKIYGGSGSGLELLININTIIGYWTHKASKDFYIEVKVKIEANTNRITNLKTTNVPQRGGIAKWTTTAADQYEVDLYYAISAGVWNEIRSTPKTITINTEEIPFALETTTITVQATLKSVSGSTGYPDTNELQVYFRNLEIGLVDTTKSPPILGQISEIEIESPYKAENSIERDYGLLRIADNLGTQTQAQFNSIGVKQPNDAGTIVGSTTWVAGHTTDADIITTLLTEVIALQKLPSRKYIGEFKATIYEAWNVGSYDGELWVFMGGRYSSKSDIWDVEWFGIAYSPTVAITTVSRDKDVNNKTYPPVHRDFPTDKKNGYYIGTKSMAETDTKYDDGDTITSFSIYSSSYNHIRQGDNILLLFGNTLEKIQEFAVTADVLVGDTSVSVTSDTADDIMNEKSVIAHEPREYTVSEVVRAVAKQELGGSGNNKVELILRAETSATGTAEATTDGATATTSNTYVIADDTSAAVMAYISAKSLNGADVLYYVRKCLIVNDSGATAIVGSVETIGTDVESAGIVGASVTITANDTNDALKVDVAGIGALNLSWTILILAIQTSY